MTGDLGREAYFGLTKDIDSSPRERKYSFSNFTFPACGVCNGKYAQLEAQVKPIMEDILAGTPVLADHLSVFLDWMDKVRVGLWLGMSQLDRNYASVDPNFYIESRIGQYDRLLFVEKSDLERPRLNFSGVDTLSFALTPSVFVLIVNNFYFTNVSSFNLFSRRLGFPYPLSAKVMPDSDRLNVTMTAGTSRIMQPLLRRVVHERGIRVYQPMFGAKLVSGSLESYQTPYKKAHSMNHSSGVGNIFMETSQALYEFGAGEMVVLNPTCMHSDQELFIGSAITICEWQNWLVSLLPTLDLLSKEQKRYVRERFSLGIKLNNHFIAHYRDILTDKLLQFTRGRRCRGVGRDHLGSD